MKKTMFAVALGALATSPVLAQDEGEERIAREGFRIEARANYETPTVSNLFDDDDIYKLGSAISFGGEAGLDFAVSDNVTVGPYGQYEISTVESEDGGFTVRTTDYIEAGLHLGVALNTTGQIYGKLGYAQLGFETEGLGLDTTEEGAGIAFSLGYELGLGQNLYARIEGGYADVGQVYGLKWQRRHLGIALGARF